MASDDAYAAFLEKANKDPGAGRAPAAPAGAASAADAHHQQNVPAALTAATQGQFYASDADEPFVAVALPLGDGSGELPTEDDFLAATRLPYAASAVTILDPVDWDRRGQYRGLLEAVRGAGQGRDVRVYRVQQDATRAQYWLVTTTDAGQLVGVKAQAVES